jgi:precorrin-4 methylase
VPPLLVEVTQAREVAAIAEAACATAMLTAETSALKVVVTRDSTALRVKDAEDLAALAEREALERVSRPDA